MTWYVVRTGATTIVLLLLDKPATKYPVLSSKFELERGLAVFPFNPPSFSGLAVSLMGRFLALLP